MSTRPLSRRSFLTRTMALGCSAAASPLLAPVTFADAPWETRLVTIILRGAMDGLDAVRPYGDPNFAATHRAAPESAADLDGFFALHPGLSGLMPLWRSGELAVAHAVSTPYRDKRSHFDGQDLLEAGTPDLLPATQRDGWLNRMLQVSPITGTRTAFAIGSGQMPILDGSADAASWTPGANVSLSPQARLLAERVMQSDPLLSATLAEALALADPDDGNSMMGRGRGGRRHVTIAEFAAQQLRQDTRIAAFSLNGWDTHRNQNSALNGSLNRFAETLLTLKSELGDVWGKTIVIAMTEFGRTVRINGTKGTDHGTGGAMILAGGALRGGKVVTDWPGLAEADLYKRRDLMPTRDVRAHAAWIMRGLFGLSQSDLERTIFPGLDMGSDPGLIL